MDAIEQHDAVAPELQYLGQEDDGLKHNLEEEAVLDSDDQVRELTAQLEEYENVMHRLLAAAGIHSGNDEETHLGHHVNGTNTAIDQVKILRVALKEKTELLQLTEDKYEEFMSTSYELEKSLIHENEALKRLVNELRVENARLQRTHESNQSR
ncbi:hypothetical protein DVH05_019622 [Phytophthora capsici]|nr:hypothetical protein DVH05_019622 [Phytophthora capsici]